MMNRIKTIIIDDEPDSVQLLTLQLSEYCPTVDIIKSFNSPVKALDYLPQVSFDLLLLDVEMPVLNGFELLEKLQLLDFRVVFITAYNQYAIRAFRINALDYLVKPVDTADLVRAIARAEKSLQPSAAQINQVQKHLMGQPITRIAVPGQNGISFIDISSIIYAEASNNYSRIVLTDGSHFIISKTLKDVQEVLEEDTFLRIHRQYIVNLNHVKQLNRTDGVLIMDNGMHLPIARNQKERLIERYRWL